MYLFVYIADFHRFFATKIQLFIETYKLYPKSVIRACLDFVFFRN